MHGDVVWLGAERGELHREKHAHECRGRVLLPDEGKVAVVVASAATETDQGDGVETDARNEDEIGRPRSEKPLGQGRRLGDAEGTAAEALLRQHFVKRQSIVSAHPGEGPGLFGEPAEETAGIGFSGKSRVGEDGGRLTEEREPGEPLPYPRGSGGSGPRHGRRWPSPPSPRP